MYIGLLSSLWKISLSFGSCVVVAGALVINESSFVSLSGNVTSSTEYPDLYLQPVRSRCCTRTGTVSI